MVLQTLKLPTYHRISTSKVYSQLVYKEARTFTALLIYVDDLILIRSHAPELTFVKTHLHKHFSIEDLRDLHYFLALEVLLTTLGIISHSENMPLKP